jgi:glycosyltransferase involved in cell wall biosynthesis
MRILAATDQWYPDTAGGTGRVATETARRLASRGHEVTILAPRSEGDPRESREGSLTVLRTLARSVLPQTVTDLVETRRHARGLPGPVDVLLGHQSTTALGLRAGHPATPLALVYHASALRELRFLRSQLPRGLRRLATYPLEPPLAVAERRAIRRASAILLLSEFSRSLLEADHPAELGKVRRVEGGVDTSAFAPDGGPEPARARLGIAEGIRLLVTVRRLEPRTGVDQLLRTVPALPADVELAVIGSGLLDATLRGLAAQLGVADRVRFPGRVPDDELRDWYRAADLFVLPTVAYEGFGLVTVEALASGTPVVGTPVGATPELLRPLDPRLVADSASPDALARAIVGALAFADPDFRRRCRAYAAERYAWDAVIVGWEKALEELVARSRSSAAVA